MADVWVSITVADPIPAPLTSPDTTYENILLVLNSISWKRRRTFSCGHSVGFIHIKKISTLHKISLFSHFVTFQYIYIYMHLTIFVFKENIAANHKLQVQAGLLE